MSMFMRGMLAALVACASLKAHAGSVELRVGDAQVPVAVPVGQVRVSQASPQLFDLYATLMPASHRLVEAFATEADVSRSLAGEFSKDVAYQVQVVLNVEGRDVGAAEWREGRPQVAREIGLVDMQAVSHALAPGASERLSAAAGAPVELRFGEAGRMSAYGDDPRSVRFSMLMPVSARAAGTSITAQVECAGAVTVVHGKLLFLYAYRVHHDGDDASIIRTALDRWVDATLALDR